MRWLYFALVLTDGWHLLSFLSSGLLRLADMNSSDYLPATSGTCFGVPKLYFCFGLTLAVSFGTFPTSHANLLFFRCEIPNKKLYTGLNFRHFLHPVFPF